MIKLSIKFVVMCGFLLSCGTDPEPRIIEIPPDPPANPDPGTPPGNGGGGSTSFGEARQIIGQYCEGCHANSPWLKDDASLRSSSVKARTRNKSMPPNSAPRRMPDEARLQLLKFF